jgi:hypothetical protein
LFCGAKWRELADRYEADRHTLCKFLDWQLLFTGFFHMYAATYKEMNNSLKPSSKKSGQEDASQAEQNKRRKRERNYQDECCTKKQKRPPPTYQNPRPVATNNFFVPFTDLPKENVETGSEGNSTKTPETNESPGNGRPPPIVLTSEANTISLQRELRIVVSREFFRITATGTRFTINIMVDYSTLQKMPRRE